MEIKILKPEFGYGSNTYLIESDGEYAIVDPSTSDMIDVIAPKIKYIFLTHAHIDHMLTVTEWQEKSGAPVFVGQADEDKLKDSDKNVYRLFFSGSGGYYGKASVLSDGQKLQLGNTDITVMCTPGHTSGSIVYLIGDGALVGDVVFARGGFGRYDLPSGNPTELVNSIKRIMSLPPETVLYPGHGETTTVKESREYFNL